MTDKQWQDLLNVINGKILKPLPVGFIVDCPWLPNWYGKSILDYFTSEEIWLNANLKAVNEFKDVIFLPGFWSEFGMCTEPSAFGVRCIFPKNEFPHAHKIIRSTAEIDELVIPNPATDGLLPFVLNRLKLAQPKIEKAGYKIRFAVARGPLNISSYLMGATEFLMAMMLEPNRTHLLLNKVTTFLKEWLKLQIEAFPSIDGIFLLDDIIGFIGEKEFKTFALPYFKQLYDADVSVKFLHNDAQCGVSLPFLPEIGINLFNMGFDTSLNDLKKMTQNKVVMLGNIPPRDVLASGSTEDVRKAAIKLLDSLEDKSRVIFSCGGGMPPGVSSKNLKTFVETIHNFR
ncbi:MAG: uroporphyrinogen decarboxylase family protein [Candidatus Ratteibacteria bacterium]|nr:uroporphyrinogen decarboxylase family protein [Candidatus Ratteibacteria bacterium]